LSARQIRRKRPTGKTALAAIWHQTYYDTGLMVRRKAEKKEKGSRVTVPLQYYCMIYVSVKKKRWLECRKNALMSEIYALNRNTEVDHIEMLSLLCDKKRLLRRLDD
jgi:hypothetical protein